MLNTQFANSRELLFAKDFADRIVPNDYQLPPVRIAISERGLRIIDNLSPNPISTRNEIHNTPQEEQTHHHPSLFSDSSLKLRQIQGPIVGRTNLRISLRGGMQRNVDNLSTSHLNVGNILIVERLHDNDLITCLNEGHKGAQNALICAGGDNNLGGGIELTTEEWRVGVRESLTQAETTLSGRILVTINSIQRFFRSIQDKLRRVVATVIIIFGGEEKRIRQRDLYIIWTLNGRGGGKRPTKNLDRD